MKANIKVCHIVSGDIWAGAESQVFNLLLGLSPATGVSPVVITFNNGTLSGKLIQNGINTFIVDENSNNTIQMVFKIFRIIKDEKIDIVHVHGYKETFLGGLAAKFSSKPVVRTFHGMGLINSSTTYRFLEKINSFLCDKLISVSENLKETLKKYYNESNIKVIRNCIDLQKITVEKSAETVRAEFGISNDTFIIGTLGRLVNVKGLEYLLKSVKELIKHEGNICFVIVGDGPLKKELHNITVKEGIENHVKLVGHRNDPFNLLNIFDIFVLPSLHEGLPMVLLEAMSLGKPIIATNVGGIPEIISDRKNGLLVKPKDVHGLQAACIELIDNKILRSQLSETGEKMVNRDHNLGKMVAKVVQLYGEMI